MGNNGFIKLHRKIRDNEVWSNNDPFDKRSAFIDLLLSANHEKGVAIIGTKNIPVNSGSFITSKLKLATRWNWSRKKVTTFLKLLKSLGMVTTKSTTTYTTVTIENWAKYQYKGTSEDTTDDTTKEQQKNTNKNNKEINNIYNYVCSPDEEQRKKEWLEKANKLFKK